MVGGRVLKGSGIFDSLSVKISDIKHFMDILVCVTGPCTIDESG